MVTEREWRALELAERYKALVERLIEERQPNWVVYGWAFIVGAVGGGFFTWLFVG